MEAVKGPNRQNLGQVGGRGSLLLCFLFREGSPRLSSPPPCNPGLPSERKGHPQALQEHSPFHIPLFSASPCSQDWPFPRNGGCHTSTRAVLCPGPALELHGRAEMRLCKATLLHLKGGCSKQSNSQPVALAPDELLIGFPLVMLCSRSTGCFFMGG